MPHKLLMYSDGACTFNGRKGAAASGSFAAYLVPCGTIWGWHGPESEEKHLRLKEEGRPLVHMEKMTVVAGAHERPTNNLAEAKTLESALIWARNYVRDHHDDVTSVEVCMDSRTIEYQLKGVYRTNAEHLKRIHARILDIIDEIEVPVHLVWIPGTLMKQTIIAH